jgi:hypothetical protein
VGSGAGGFLIFPGVFCDGNLRVHWRRLDYEAEGQ